MDKSELTQLELTNIILSETTQALSKDRDERIRAEIERKKTDKVLRWAVIFASIVLILCLAATVFLGKIYLDQRNQLRGINEGVDRITLINNQIACSTEVRRDNPEATYQELSAIILDKCGDLDLEDN